MGWGAGGGPGIRELRVRRSYLVQPHSLSGWRYEWAGTGGSACLYEYLGTFLDQWSKLRDDLSGGTSTASCEFWLQLHILICRLVTVHIDTYPSTASLGAWLSGPPGNSTPVLPINLDRELSNVDNHCSKINSIHHQTASLINAFQHVVTHRVLLVDSGSRSSNTSAERTTRMTALE